MAPADPESVQFKTASGRILSPEQTKAVLARLAGADQNPDSLARHLALEQEVSGTPLSLGNRVVLLENGPDTYAAMLSAIDDGARPHQHGDLHPRGRRGRPALRRCPDRQAGPGRAGQPDPRQRRHAAHADGVLQAPHATPASPCVEFNPVNPLAAKAGWEVNQRDHRKLLVVDGRIAILGGINISSVYSGGSSSVGGSGGSGGKAERQGPPALARHRPAGRGTGGCAAAEALHGNLGRTEGTGARAAQLLPDAGSARQGGRARHRQHARRAVQPDLRDADLGPEQRRHRDPPHECLLRAGSAAGGCPDRAPRRAASTSS